MLKLIKHHLVSIFTLALITLIFFTIYAAVQQGLRQSANDPQIQAAEDVSTELSAGAQPQNIVAGTNKADIATSPDAFIIIFDGSGQPVISSAQLNGSTPIPPAGTFAYTKQAGEDTFTWQPQSGLREATVMAYSSGSSPYFVLVGRSLKETDSRSNRELAIIIGAWLIAIAGYLGFAAAEHYLLKKTV